MEVYSDPRAVYHGVDILAACTDSAVPVVIGDWLEPGTHITCVAGGLDAAALGRIDRSLRLGSSPAPIGRPDLHLADEFIAYLARPDADVWKSMVGGMRGAGTGVVAADRAVFFSDIVAGREPGRQNDQQVTFSARGNVQGAQFHAVAGAVYEQARAHGIGRELPTAWFLQDIRD